MIEIGYPEYRCEECMRYLQYLRPSRMLIGYDVYYCTTCNLLYPFHTTTGERSV